MIPPSIREATSDDAGEIADIWTEAYVTLGVSGRTEPYSAADFFSSARDGTVFVADNGNRIAGVVALCGPAAPRRIVAIGEEAELSRLAVASSARRAGIGRALVELCERRAREEDWSAIALWSRPLQDEAHRLYESLGYRRLPQRDSVDATGRERLAFGLAIEPTARMAR